MIRSARFHDWFERCAIAFAALAIAIVLIAQAQLLYRFPQPDGARWWGDETGQMLELRAEITDGYAHIPTALGSSVGVTNGIVRGNSWLAAAIYGVPELLFSHRWAMVDIGRTISFALSLALLMVLYKILRSAGVSMLLALVAILLLVSTRSFFYASHSARLDIAAGLAMLLFAWYGASRDRARLDGRWNPTRLWYFCLGMVVMVSATLSIHLLTLVPALTVVSLWRFRAFRDIWAVASVVAGAVVIVGIIFLTYYLSGAPISLFGPSAGTNQFQTVSSSLPIVRPFSRSVQWANILERFHGFWNEAPTFLLWCAIAVACMILQKLKRSRPRHGAIFAWMAVAAAISWMLLQSPALYYYIHIMPLIVVAATMGISRQWGRTTVTTGVLLFFAIILGYAGLHDALRAEELSNALEDGNHLTLSRALDVINSGNESQKPIVLAQNPAIACLEHDTTVRLMTAHFVSFPVSHQPTADIMRQIGVKYIILYAPRDGSVYSDDYAALRRVADSIGTVVLRVPGNLFDVHRDYFSSDAARIAPSLDTLILYKFPSFAH